MDAALGLFASVQASTTQIAEKSKTKTLVVLSLPEEPDRKEKRDFEKLLASFVFLFRGRDDITLVQSALSEVQAASFAVFKDGAQVATVTNEGDLKERVVKLVEQIGWNPDCPDETHRASQAVRSEASQAVRAETEPSQLVQPILDLTMVRPGPPQAVRAGLLQTEPSQPVQLHNYLTPINAEELLGDVAAFTASTGQRDYVANTANVASIIWHAFTEVGRPINWAGFYFVRSLANPKEMDHDHILILGPFMGKPACSRIRFQSGVCGASWRAKSVQRIADVHEFPDHIACDDASESELVVPIFDEEGEVLALIDLDCPKKNGFSAEDERTLVEVARVTSKACDWDNVGLPYTQP